MQAIVLAAGKGTRLHPLTHMRTKAMAPVVGRPLVAWVLDTLVPVGLDEILLVVGPDDAEIRAYFAGYTGPPVRFVVQPERRGMAHALALAAPSIRGPFLVSACDNLTSPAHVAALVAAHEKHDAAASLSLMEVDLAEVSKTGIVVWDAPFVRRIVEKPRPEEAPSTISSLPLYLFSPEILEYLAQVQPSARGEYELQDAIQMLIERTGRVTGVFTATRRQVTNAADLLALNLAILGEAPDQIVVAPDVEVGADVRLVPPVRVDAGTVIGAGATVGPQVYVEGPSRIGAGAMVEDALVLRHAVVDDGFWVHGAVVD